MSWAAGHVMKVSEADSSRSPKSIAATRQPGRSAARIRRHVAQNAAGARKGRLRLALTRSQDGTSTVAMSATADSSAQRW